MTTHSRSSEAVQQKTRHQLLEAARRLFAERGYRGATLRQICEAAGANSAAINYHFGDKRQLYLEVIRTTPGSVAQHTLPQWPADTPPAQRLFDFVYGFLETVLVKGRSGESMRLMFREMADPSEGTAGIVEEFLRPRLTILLEIIGELAPELGPEERKLTAFSILGQCIYYHVGRSIIPHIVSRSQRANHTPEALARHISHFSLRALGQPEPYPAKASQVAKDASK